MSDYGKDHAVPGFGADLRRRLEEVHDDELGETVADLVSKLKESGEALSTFMRLEPDIKRLKDEVLRLLLDRQAQ